MRPVLAFLALTFTAGYAQADDNFLQNKSRMKEQIDLQVEELQKANACISGAQDMAELKKCHMQKRMGLRDLKKKLQSKRGNLDKAAKPAADDSKSLETIEEMISD